jgi:hypothetical protein
MATKKKAASPHQKADQFYDYLIAHKNQVLRYITAALITGLIQFLLQYFLQMGSFLAFVLRFTLLLPILKYGVYREKTDIFYSLRQLMIAIMLVILLQFGINYLIIFFSSLTGKGKLFYYLFTGVLEVLYFIIFQFIVFKEKKD